MGRRRRIIAKAQMIEGPLPDHMRQLRQVTVPGSYKDPTGHAAGADAASMANCRFIRQPRRRLSGAKVASRPEALPERPATNASRSGENVSARLTAALMRTAIAPKKGARTRIWEKPRQRTMAPGTCTLVAQARVRGQAAKLLTLSPKLAPIAKDAKHKKF